MPSIKVMTWNIENTGPGTLNQTAVNGASLLSYMAEVILENEADLVCLQEVTSSASSAVGFLIAETLNDAVGAMEIDGGEPVWGVALSPKPSKSLSDGYSYIWKTAVLSAVLTNTGYAQVGLAASNFPTNSGRLMANGRKAAYMLFSLQQAQNPGNLLMVANYHAPKAGSDGAEFGLTAISEMAGAALGGVENQFSPPLVAGQTPCAFLACGDYNLDYEDYDDLYEEVGQAECPLTTAFQGLTSLTTVESAQNRNLQEADTTEPFLANAYDNFLYTANAFLQCTATTLVDTIAQGKANGPLTPFLGGYFTVDPWNDMPAFSNAALCQNPPANSFQSFVFFRGAVSDHMPVLGTFNVNF